MKIEGEGRGGEGRGTHLVFRVSNRDVKSAANGNGLGPTGEASFVGGC